MIAEETVEGGSSRAELVEMTERSGS
jgi:hypothetical protein